MHILSRLIETCPTTYGPKSCDEERFVDPSRGAPWSSVKRNFSKFSSKKKRAVIFYVLANPGGTAYLSFRDRELSNNIKLVQFRRRRVAVHTFLGWFQAGLLRLRSHRNYRKPEHFCLRSYPGEISYPTSANQELSIDCFVAVMFQRKVALHTSTPYANWSMTKRCFHHFGGS